MLNILSLLENTWQSEKKDFRSKLFSLFLALLALGLCSGRMHGGGIHLIVDKEEELDKIRPIPALPHPTPNLLPGFTS